MHQVVPIDSIKTDKAYDQIRVYEASNDHMNDSGQLKIHSMVNTVISALDEVRLGQRNQHITSTKQDGVIAWRRTSSYYRQSEVENMFFRYKKRVGDELRARGEKSRKVEPLIP